MEKLFDSHAHYFDKRFNEAEGGADSLLQCSEFADSVFAVVNVGTNYENSLVCIEQAKKYDLMYAAVGIHPEDAQTVCSDIDVELEKIYGLVKDADLRKQNKIVAIGECGYDYHWQPVNKELQQKVFHAQMEMAKELDMPVIIHNREAHKDTFDMICSFPSVRGVLHSCSMSGEMVKELVKRGWYISFSGTLTFKNAKNVREACATVPLDRILIETDAPYLAPVPYRGKLNNSILMKSTCECAATIFGISFEKMAEITRKNAENLFGL